jgi:hypothetical protein
VEAVLHLAGAVLDKVGAVHTRQHAIPAVLGADALRSDFPSNLNIPRAREISTEEETDTYQTGARSDTIDLTRKHSIEHQQSPT